MDEFLSSTDYVKMITTLWAIWKARRDIIHEDVYQSPFETCNFITHFLHELGLIDSAEQRGQQDRQRWICPPKGAVKGNVDATLSYEINSCSAAAIFRADDVMVPTWGFGIGYGDCLRSSLC
jgi:hypothetical protein